MSRWWGFPGGELLGELARGLGQRRETRHRGLAGRGVQPDERGADSLGVDEGALRPDPDARVGEANEDSAAIAVVALPGHEPKPDQAVELDGDRGRGHSEPVREGADRHRLERIELIENAGLMIGQPAAGGAVLHRAPSPGEVEGGICGEDSLHLGVEHGTNLAKIF